MKKNNRIMALCGAVTLAAVVIVGGFSAAATGGDQSDPLVSLSYLTQVLTPQLLDKVDEQVAVNEQELTDKLNAAIDEYSLQMEQILSREEMGSAAYTVVQLSSGQTLFLEVGSELLLRSGTAKVSTASAGALLDTTAGNSLAANGSLAANHLYVAPQDATGITVSASTVFLVRGNYTIA